MPNPRTFRVSDDLFQGFTITIDLDYYDSNEEICRQMQQSLVGFFGNHGLETLMAKANELRLHMHNIDFCQILLSESDKEFWVCGHCIAESTPTSAPASAPASAPVTMSVTNNNGENLVL